MSPILCGGPNPPAPQKATALGWRRGLSRAHGAGPDPRQLGSLCGEETGTQTHVEGGLREDPGEDGLRRTQPCPHPSGPKAASQWERIRASGKPKGHPGDTRGRRRRTAGRAAHTPGTKQTLRRCTHHAPGGDIRCPCALGRHEGPGLPDAGLAASSRPVVIRPVSPLKATAIDTPGHVGSSGGLCIFPILSEGLPRAGDVAQASEAALERA